MGFITKLDATNKILMAAGESPVPDLSGSSSVDTSIIDFLIEQSSIDFQIRGLCNNKKTIKRKPDVNLRIYLPMGDSDDEGILDASLKSTHLTSDSELIVAKVFNNGTGGANSVYLYNFTEDTEFWKATDEYFIELIMKLKWSHLDTTAQLSICTSASRSYQILTQGDQATDSYLSDKEYLYKLIGKASDINKKQRNIFMSGDANVRNAALRNPYINDNTFRRFWNGGR